MECCSSWEFHIRPTFGNLPNHFKATKKDSDPENVGLPEEQRRKPSEAKLGPLVFEVAAVGIKDRERG